MKTELLSISKIFTERLFRIPDYQRGYAWGEKQLREYWNDIVQLQEGKNHYCGVLMLEEVTALGSKCWDQDKWIISSRSYHPYYIVDGQQRLTTTLILLQSIIETMRDGETLNYQDCGEIQKKYIFETKDRGISRSYLFGYDVDNPSYEYLKTEIFLEHNENQNTNNETVYTNNLKRAKEFFRNNLQGLGYAQVEQIYKKVTQNLLFNIYSISEEVDTHVAFETLNNRGKPLTLLELLKTRLIYLSTRFASDATEKETLRHNINEAWKAIYHNLGKNKNKPLEDDAFLFNHYIFYFLNSIGDSEDSASSVPYRRMVRDWENFKEKLLEDVFTVRRLPEYAEEKYADKSAYISIDEINKYATSLKKSVETFYYLNNPEFSPYTEGEKIWLTRLNNLGFSGSIPLLMVLFQERKRSGNHENILAQIEKHNFLSNLLDYYYGSPGQVNLLYFAYAQLLHSKKTNVEKILSELTEKSNQLTSSSYFTDRMQEAFKARGFYNWKIIRYFLYEYEQYLRSSSKTERNKLDWDVLCSTKYQDPMSEYITVEHIYPRRPGRSAYWSKHFGGYDANKRSALRDSLGNLLALSKPKNSSLGNRSFPEKLGDENNTIGYRYGCFSENEVAMSVDWTPRNIYSRGLKLLNFMEKRWGIGLGNDAEKARLLGLTFMRAR